MSDESVKPPSEPAPSGTGDVLSGSDKPARSARPKAGIGGTHSHSPLCKCYPCKARRRKQEALAIAAGAGRADVDGTYIPNKEQTTKTGIKKAAPKALRDRVAQYIHFSMMYPNAAKMEIAEKMGISAKRLYEIVQQGREEGLIEFSDPLERIDYEIIPKIVDNLNFFLDARDKTVTIEAAKGTLFKTYADSKGITEGNQTVLALKIEMPDGQDVKLLAGRIVGQPKNLNDDAIIDLEAFEDYGPKN